MLYLLALSIGWVAGLRALTAPAALAWGAYLDWLPLADTWAGFIGNWIAVSIITILALLEFVLDQLPSTPSRKVPLQFGTRLASGAFTGAVIGTTGGAHIDGLIAGIIGAAIGTYGGSALRTQLAAALGQDLPAGLIEDVVAILLALWVVSTVS